ncbi:MAG: bifunctional sugar-1-phosphate nucleotidylyltransferase/acetyltransferase [archaeon]
MQAVILAAGKGTRIYPFSIEKPKPLIEVANKPVLEHNLDQMLGLIDEVIIIVGYKKDMIMDRIGDHYHNIKIKYVVQEKTLGTGHAVAMAEQEVSGKFLVINGDDLFSRKDMENLLKFDNCILVQEKENVSAFGVIEAKDGKVVNIIEKPVKGQEPSKLVNVGMYAFTPEIFQILKTLPKSERGEYEITDAVRVLAQQGKMFYQELKGFWIPVGYPWHILEATETLLEEEEGSSIKGKIEEGVTIDGSVDIGKGSLIKSGTILKGNIIIGENCVVGENCLITGYTAIGNNSEVSQGTGLDNVIVGSGAKIGKKCMVKDSVLGENVELSPGVRIENIGNCSGKPCTVKVKLKNKTLDSGKKRLGAFVADNCKVKGKLEPGECRENGNCN